MQALDLAQLYRVMFGELRLLGRVSFRSEITSPDGPSTGGGVQAMQHVMLIPVQGGAPLVVGHANKADRSAQIRTYEHVASQFRTRFKSEVPFKREDYDAFIGQVWNFLQSQQLVVTAEPFTPPAAIAPQGSGGRGVILLLVGTAIVVALAVAIALNV